MGKMKPSAKTANFIGVPPRQGTQPPFLLDVGLADAGSYSDRLFQVVHQPLVPSPGDPRMIVATCPGEKSSGEMRHVVRGELR